MDVPPQFVKVEHERQKLEKALNTMISIIGPIPIANKRIMPYGWRKAAKGRTVWRIIEEIISQNLEKNHKEYGFEKVSPAESEVGVYDFEFKLPDGSTSFVNIKSAVDGTKPSKDDISKGDKLFYFYKEHQNENLYVATFVIKFHDDMTITMEKCIVFPISWIPDVYVNPSNNGNLQSSFYKDLSKAVCRTNQEFEDELFSALEIATKKKKRKFESITIDQLSDNLRNH